MKYDSRPKFRYKNDKFLDYFLIKNKYLNK